MPIIGDLITRFTADMTDLHNGIAQYGKELSEAEKKNKDFNTGLAAIKNTVANVSAGIALGTGIIAGFILKATGYADAMKDASEATGLSVEQLQRWKAAGTQTGVTMEEFSSTARMMTARMGEVADPASQMSKDLASIGVSAYDANGKLKDTNTMMWDIIKGLEKQPAGMERSSKALAILGRSWYNIAPMINDAAEAQEAYNAADPFDERKIMALHEYKIAIDKAGAAMERWEVTIGDKLTPLITSVFVPAIDAITGAVTLMSETWDKAQFAIALSYLKTQSILTGDSSKLNAFFTANKGVMNPSKSGSSVPGTSNGLGPDNSALADAEKKMWSDMADATDEYKDALQDVIDEKQRLADMDKDYAREMSVAGWDVARARDLTIRHGWAEEDQNAKIGSAQSALGAAAGKVGEAQLAIAGNLILQVNGYNKTLGQAVQEGQGLAKQRVVAGIPS